MQPSKYLDDHLPGKNSVSSVQRPRMRYNTDKYWPQFNHFSMSQIIISLRSEALEEQQKIFWKRVYCWLPWLKKKLD